MKHLFRFLLALASWLPAHLATAQFTLGLSGGLNLASQKNHDDNPFLEVDYGFAPQWRAGLNFEYRFAQRFSVGLEAAFAKKGNRYSGIELTDENGQSLGQTSFRDIWQYWDNSAYLKYRLLVGKARPYLMAGTSIGYLAEARRTISETQSPGISLPYTFQFPIENYNRTDFALLGGAGVEITAGKQGFLFAEARYQHGLNDLSKSETTALRNRNLSFTAGYAFLFGVE